MFNSNSVGQEDLIYFSVGLRGIYKSNYIASQIVLESEAASHRCTKAGKKGFYLFMQEISEQVTQCRCNEGMPRHNVLM